MSPAVFGGACSKVLCQLHRLVLALVLTLGAGVAADTRSGALAPEGTAEHALWLGSRVQALREALGRKKLPPIVPKEEKPAEKQAA